MGKNKIKKMKFLKQFTICVLLAVSNGLSIRSKRSKPSGWSYSYPKRMDDASGWTSGWTSKFTREPTGWCATKSGLSQHSQDLKTELDSLKKILEEIRAENLEFRTSYLDLLKQKESGKSELKQLSWSGQEELIIDNKINYSQDE